MKPSQDDKLNREQKLANKYQYRIGAGFIVLGFFGIVLSMIGLPLFIPGFNIYWLTAAILSFTAMIAFGAVITTNTKKHR